MKTEETKQQKDIKELNEEIHTVFEELSVEQTEELVLTVLNADEAIPKEQEKKKQKISVSYTVRSFGENIKKLIEAKMLTGEEIEQAKLLHKTAVERWISIQMNI